MKKIIIIAAIILGIGTAQAQNQQDTLTNDQLRMELATVADTIVSLDSLYSRPLIVTDSLLNHYATVDSFALQFTSAVLQIKSKNGMVIVDLERGKEPSIRIRQDQYKRGKLSTAKILKKPKK